jgi:hypothetical protein
MDSGLWINWYNLPEAGREEYLAWLHGDYIPKVLARPGVREAAHYASESNFRKTVDRREANTTDDTVPIGDRYILIFEGDHPYAFVNPAPAQFHAGLSETDRKRLAMRIGERSNIMTIEAQVYGPEAKAGDKAALSPGIQLGSFNSGSYKDEDELATWYAQWRLPCMEKLPGCIRVRKLLSVSGWAKFACFYEFVSVEARNQHFVGHDAVNPQMKAWTDTVVHKLVHAPGSPNVARRIWPPVA